MPLQISKIILRKVQMELINPLKNSLTTVQDKTFFIIEVHDIDGLIGYGETVAFDSPWYTEETVQTNEHIICDFLIPLLRKATIHHPTDIAKLFSQIKRNQMAKAAIEQAMWDIFSKRENTPLFKYIGGQTTEIEAGISLGIEPTIDRLLEKIKFYHNKGYKRVKIKIKHGWDINVFAEIRKVFPQLPLMADANGDYTMDDLDHIKLFDPYRILMLEQPFKDDAFVEHAELQKAIQTPICLDESIHSLSDVKLALQLGSCQIINIKIGRVGGLTEAIKIHDLCHKHNVAVWSGGMFESGIGRAYNIALSTLPGFTLPGDIGESTHYWKNDLVSPLVTVENGIITAPNASGIGYSIDNDLLNTFTVDMKEFIF